MLAMFGLRDPMKRGFMVAAVTCCAIASANAAPIWDTYPTLVCRYDQAQFCDLELTKCTKDAGRAVLSFDFRKSEMRSFVDKAPVKIVGRYYYASKLGDTNTVQVEGTLYSFEGARKGLVSGETDTILGMAQSSSFGSPMTFTAHMTCHPT
jgi:hypothetical protein